MSIYEANRPEYTIIATQIPRVHILKTGRRAVPHRPSCKPCPASASRHQPAYRWPGAQSQPVRKPLSSATSADRGSKRTSPLSVVVAGIIRVADDQIKRPLTHQPSPAGIRRVRLPIVDGYLQGGLAGVHQRDLPVRLFQCQGDTDAPLPVPRSTTRAS